MENIDHLSIDEIGALCGGPPPAPKPESDIFIPERRPEIAVHGYRIGPGTCGGCIFDAPRDSHKWPHTFDGACRLTR